MQHLVQRIGLCAGCFMLIALVAEFFWRGAAPIAVVCIIYSAFATCSTYRDPALQKVTEAGRSAGTAIRRWAKAEVGLGILIGLLLVPLYMENEIFESLAGLIFPALGAVVAVIHFVIVPAVASKAFASANASQPGAPKADVADDDDEQETSYKPVQVVALFGAVFLVAGTGWSVSAHELDWPRPSQVGAFLDFGFGEAEPEVSSGPEDTSPEHPGSQRAGNGERAYGADPGAHKGSGRGGNDCARRTVKALRSFRNELAGDAMADLWLLAGQQEVGCLASGPRPSGGMLVARLTGSRMSPAVLVSDLAGRAAIVTEGLVRRVLRLIEQGELAFVTEQQPTDAGSYQVLFTATGGCRLAITLSGRHYSILPAPASALIMSVSAIYDAPPSFISPVADDGRRRVVTAMFETSKVEHSATVVIGASGNARVMGEPALTADDETRCPEPPPG